MNLKKLDIKPEGYLDWTVYPLEGIWDINDKAIHVFDTIGWNPMEGMVWGSLSSSLLYYCCLKKHN